MEFSIGSQMGISIAVAGILAYHLIPLVVHAAKRFGILDNPDGKIKNHKEPIPYMGGLAIYISFILAVSVFCPFEPQIGWFLLGLTVLVFIGFVDDLKNLKPLQKILGQLIAVVCFLHGGLALKAAFFSSIFNVSISVLWMLSMINAFNLIDVMDGLSSSVALLVGTNFLILSLLLQHYTVSILLIALLGSVAAFFWYNKPPAKIYMGDAGSLLLGGFFAALPMLIKWSSISFDTYYTPIILLAVPLIEIGSLVIIRTWKGIPFYKGSPHHFALYLQKKGFTPWHVLLFAAGTNLFLGGVALLYMFNVIHYTGLVVAGLFLSIYWYVFVFSPYFSTSSIPQVAKEVVPAVGTTFNSNISNRNIDLLQ